MVPKGPHQFPVDCPVFAAEGRGLYMFVSQIPQHIGAARTHMRHDDRGIGGLPLVSGLPIDRPASAPYGGSLTLESEERGSANPPPVRAKIFHCTGHCAGRTFFGKKKPSAGHCVVTPITKICSESIPPISQMSAETCHT